MHNLCFAVSYCTERTQFHNGERDKVKVFKRDTVRWFLQLEAFYCTIPSTVESVAVHPRIELVIFQELLS